MDEEQILFKLQLIFREILENNKIIITKNTSMDNIDGWDSLSHINIIGLIETKFKIHFSIGEIVVVKKVSDLIDLIQQKQNN